MKTSRDFDHAHLGDMSHALLAPIRAQKLTTLSLAITEKFNGM